jgi:hypothetical protein
MFSATSLVQAPAFVPGFCFVLMVVPNPLTRLHSLAHIERSHTTACHKYWFCSNAVQSLLEALESTQTL